MKLVWGTRLSVSLAFTFLASSALAVDFVDNLNVGGPYYVTDAFASPFYSSGDAACNSSTWQSYFGSSMYTSDWGDDLAYCAYYFTRIYGRQPAATHVNEFNARFCRNWAGVPSDHECAEITVSGATNRTGPAAFFLSSEHAKWVARLAKPYQGSGGFHIADDEARVVVCGTDLSNVNEGFKNRVGSSGFGPGSIHLSNGLRIRHKGRSNDHVMMDACGLANYQRPSPLWPMW